MRTSHKNAVTLITKGMLSGILNKVVIFKFKNGMIMGMITFIKPDVFENKVGNILYPEV